MAVAAVGIMYGCDSSRHVCMTVHSSYIHVCMAEAAGMYVWLWQQRACMYGYGSSRHVRLWQQEG